MCVVCHISCAVLLDPRCPGPSGSRTITRSVIVFDWPLMHAITPVHSRYDLHSVCTMYFHSSVVFYCISVTHNVLYYSSNMPHSPYLFILLYLNMSVYKMFGISTKLRSIYTMWQNKLYPFYIQHALPNCVLFW